MTQPLHFTYLFTCCAHWECVNQDHGSHRHNIPLQVGCEVLANILGYQRRLRLSCVQEAELFAHHDPSIALMLYLYIPTRKQFAILNMFGSDAQKLDGIAAQSGLTRHQTFGLITTLTQEDAEWAPAEIIKGKIYPPWLNLTGY